jgi:hypothetical protein
MIQRIQTVYYVIAVLLAAIALAFPIFAINDVMKAVAANAPDSETSTGVATLIPEAKAHLVLVKDAFWLMIATLGASVLLVLLLITIVLFKWLRRQAFFGKFAFWVYAGLIGYFLLVSYLINVKVQVMDASEVVWEGKVHLPLTSWFWPFAAGIVFVLLGNMGVRKDRRLLDSLNRLR